ncbi:hypothetical protein EON66_10080 [archaeon]|nr:MAG: hypothetical protein EON66_10080 [archaeon]
MHGRDDPLLPVHRARHSLSPSLQASFDWYLSYTDLKPYIAPLLASLPTAAARDGVEILIPGCGNSRMFTRACCHHPRCGPDQAGQCWHRTDNVGCNAQRAMRSDFFAVLWLLQRCVRACTRTAG